MNELAILLLELFNLLTNMNQYNYRQEKYTEKLHFPDHVVFTKQND